MPFLSAMPAWPPMPEHNDAERRLPSSLGGTLNLSSHGHAMASIAT